MRIFKYIFSAILLVQCTALIAGKEGKQWKRIVLNSTDEWYASGEAKEVAKNVLLYQRESGGWPKNIGMHLPVDEATKDELQFHPDAPGATIDNDATILEMLFLVRIINTTGEKEYINSFRRGLDYMLEAQYDNGGWPQFYPLRNGYWSHITYNDNAMVNVLYFLKDIYESPGKFGFLSEEEIKTVKASFDKGVECIIDTQIIADGKPTVWCAQHDAVTLEPRGARNYELPSFSGGESADIVMLLMSIPNPDEKIVNSVEGAVEWFRNKAIKGKRTEWYEMNDTLYDIRLVDDPEAPLLWARFYDLETGEPFFSGRDGVKKSDIQDIEGERRRGYAWYVNLPQNVLDAYPGWKKSINK